MAIIIKQNPNDVYSKHYIHQCVYPEYYTCISSIYANYIDFKYKFKLNTKDGLVSTTKNPPYTPDGVGVYNPNLYLQNILNNKFNPLITTYTPCKDSIINYRVDVEEFSSTLTTPATTSFNKQIVINANKENFDYKEYIMNNNGKFLTNWKSTRNVSLYEYGTLRFFNGILRPGYNLNENSRVYEIMIEVYRGSIIYYYTSLDSNPYWNQCSVVGQSTNNNVLEDLSNYLLEYPCLPKSLNSINWKLIGINSGGTYYPISPNVITNNIIKEGDEYWFYTYCWPYGNAGRTSIPMKFKVISRCNKKNPIQLQWENSLGGFDFYTFTKVNEKSHKITSSTYRKFRDSLGVFNKYWMSHDDYSRGETVFHNDVETVWRLNTDWLTDEEIKDLEDLWYSKNIFAYIGYDWYPVISITDSKIIESSKFGLRQYSIEIRLSNKKYI